jgi:hypothetical protein
LARVGQFLTSVIGRFESEHFTHSHSSSRYWLKHNLISAFNRPENSLANGIFVKDTPLRRLGSMAQYEKQKRYL